MMNRDTNAAHLADVQAWVEAYKHAAYPSTPYYHVSDEDIAAALDTSARHSKAAHKAQERKRQKQAEQQVQMERETQA